MVVFLALPSCPCQLFESLGLDFPHQHAEGISGASEGNPHYNGLTEWKASSDGSDQELPICHCEEGLGKMAEECDKGEFNVPTQEASKIVISESSLSSVVLFPSSAARAPPPDLLANYWLMSARTGVYRL